MKKLRENCIWSLVVPSSMGVRITPSDGQPVHCSDTFKMQATSAETNVASISSYLGLPVKVLTTFVKGSPIAAFIKGDLRRRGMAYERLSRAVLGAIVISSISRTPVLAAAAPELPTTARARSAER